MMRAGLGVVVVVGWAASFAVSAQAPSSERPTFSTRSTIVQVDAGVTDSGGQPVRGLFREDFIVTEDGVTRPVESFVFVDLPAVRDVRGAEPVDPNVHSNGPAADGRVYIMVLDDLHTQPAHTLHVQLRARQFVDQALSDNDLVAIVFTSRPSVFNLTFLNDRSALSKRIGSFIGGGSDRIDLITSRSTLSLIQRLSQWSAEVMPGRRKAMLLFSEGLDGLRMERYARPEFSGREPQGGLARPEFSGREPQGGLARPEFSGREPRLRTWPALPSTRDVAMLAQVNEEMQRAIGAAARANVSIYPIDAQGLDDFSIFNGHLSLRIMAYETGGVPVIATNAFDANFDRIVRNASSYYSLGFAPARTSKPGTYHSVRVYVRRPKLRVTATRGYADPLAQKADARSTVMFTGEQPSEAMQSVVNSPLPVRNVSLSVAHAVLRGSGMKAWVLFTIDVKGLPFRADAGRFVDDLELTAVALSDRRIEASRSEVVHLALEAPAFERTAGRLTIYRRLELDRGTYQVRIAARDGNSGRLGSVVYDLDVPDFAQTRAAVMLSGVSLLSSSSGAFVVGTEELEPAMMELPPTALRMFARADDLALLAHVYTNDAAGVGGLTITTILSGANVSARELVHVVSPEELRDTAGAINHRVDIRTSDLPAGTYTLTVTAHASGRPNIRAQQQVHFGIEN